MGSVCCLCRSRSADEAEQDGVDGEPHREIRDVVWALLFVAFWAGSWSYAGLAIQRGDPGLLVYGLDYDGNVCNRNQVPRLRTPTHPDVHSDVLYLSCRCPLPGSALPHVSCRTDSPDRAWTVLGTAIGSTRTK